jgi:hypothetical protein
MTLFMVLRRVEIDTLESCSIAWARVFFGDSFCIKLHQMRVLGVNGPAPRIFGRRKTVHVAGPRCLRITAAPGMQRAFDDKSLASVDGV